MAVLAGTTTTGGIADFFGAQDMAVTQYTAVASGTLTTLSAPFTSSGANIQFLIYADSAGAPGALLDQTGSVATANSTVSASVVNGASIVSGTAYWLGFICSTGTVNLTNRPSGGYVGRSGEASIPNPFGAQEFSQSAGLAVQADGTLIPSVITPDYTRFPKSLLRR